MAVALFRFRRTEAWLPTAQEVRCRSLLEELCPRAKPGLMSHPT